MRPTTPASGPRKRPSRCGRCPSSRRSGSRVWRPLSYGAVLQDRAVARSDPGEGAPPACERRQVLWGQRGHPPAKDRVAALAKISDQTQTRPGQAQQHAPTVRGIVAALDITGADEAVGEEARRGKAEAEKLGQVAHRCLMFVAKEKQGAHLLHRDVEVPPLARARRQKGPMERSVGGQRLFS